ncbi:MAG: Beta-propeller repeat protein [Syntrophorhabdus sp. PtaU1.Bin002]|nr:MAG: Beta-propeller repeat protein [Syntrophorhabdus sp. PtaU1.Bin002]
MTQGTKREIQGRFVLLDKTTYGFELGPYDKSQPLVIDPTLVYSTYLGGYYADHAYGIAVDSSGNMYVAGDTLATDFPTQNPYQATNTGDYDVFIAKLSPSGNSLVYSTYLGGSDTDSAYAIAIDSSGNAYVTGETYSTDFPTLNYYRGTNTGGYDAFVAKLGPSGNSLVYSTYLGGSSGDAAYAIAIDSSGNAYVAGAASSTNFPTVNAYQGSFAGGGNDAFVAKLGPSGTTLVYSTYLGGSSSDEASAIAIDSSGNAYVAGYTYSGNFPTLNPYQGTIGGSNDAFITKLSPSGQTLIYSTYLGGSSNDGAGAIAIDSSGNAYVAGNTGSINFPTLNPYQGSRGGSNDAFVAKLGPSGNSLVYSTYLGGSSGDAAYAIAIDSSGNAYVAGAASSTNFPTVNAYQGSFAGGGNDAFVAKLGPSGTTLVYSTYLGGIGYDLASAIAVDSSGNAYIAGLTYSGNFPTVNPYQGTIGGYYDAFIAKFNMSTPSDFNNDGKSDILWRNTATGQNLVWYMNGVVRTGSVFLTTVTDQNWKMVGTNDFNNDGKPDILWRNTATGQNLVWYMNGVVRTSSVFLTTVTSQAWKIVGTGDFNNDGKPDILWRNTSTGQNLVWYMNRVVRTGSVYLTTVTSQDWKIVGTNDFNNDGKSDILWRNTSTGQNLVWYMTGVSRIGAAYLTPVTDQGWKIVGEQNNY